MKLAVIRKETCNKPSTGNSLHAVIGREELHVAPKPTNLRRERWGFSRANLWLLTKLIYVIGKALSDNYCSCVLGCLQ
jgi:hypothetical protein